MGLDITAYQGLQEKPGPLADDDYEATTFLNNTDFPGRFEGLKEGVAYTYADSFGFRAGSYGGYNTWREELARMAGYVPTMYQKEMRCAAACWKGALGPFCELINFADNEGTIGPVVAAKLARDFADWDDKARAIGDYFYELYCDWRKAFDMAAKNGAVDFH